VRVSEVMETNRRQEAQLADLKRVASGHAERIQEQDGVVQGLTQALRRAERQIGKVEELGSDVSRMHDSLQAGSIQSASQREESQMLVQQLQAMKEEREAVMKDLQQRLKDSLEHIGGYSEDNRSQLSDCCEMVLKLGSKAIQEAEKLQQLKDLTAILQQRIADMTTDISNERRERRVFQEEIKAGMQWWTEAFQNRADASLLYTPITPSSPRGQFSTGAPFAAGMSDKAHLSGIGDGAVGGDGAAVNEQPLFDRLDINRDGVLDRGELDAGIERLHSARGEKLSESQLGSMK